MNAVAIDANGDLVIALREQLAMHAGEILRVLVGAQRGIKAANIGGIGVAPRTESRDLFAVRVAFESRLRAHGLAHVVGSGVAAVTIGACDSLLRVNAPRVFRGIYVKRRVQLGMTIEAAILRLCGN